MTTLHRFRMQSSLRGALGAQHVSADHQYSTMVNAKLELERWTQPTMLLPIPAQ